ncbi:MAG: phytanoyl-CoA dioxygenase family protein [Fluviicola sp.]|nr:phytanoyl-CoA dioxygenase family protein [Fluviicola sp.]
MKEPIFEDIEIQRKFDEDGFVKISLLSEQEVDTLAKMRMEYFPEKGSVFFSSSYLDDFNLKTEISNKITDIISQSLSKQCVNYRLIGAAYLIKGIGKHSEMPLHQDWTIVDEQQFYAANVWIPLTDTDEKNGTLELMKGSHKWNEALRAPTLPMSFAGLGDKIKSKLTIVPAKKGEVIILNQATIHYSKPNMTDDIRPAITTGLISQKASLKFHYWDKERNQIEEFAQEDDFLLRFENFMEAIYKRPLMGTSKQFFDYSIPSWSEEDLHRLMNTNKQSFFKRIFKKR